jgi:hypothetical protein
MRPFVIDIDVADEDTDGFADDKTAAAGVAIPLTVTAPTDGLAHKVVITPSGSVTGNYTLTGTDSDGDAQTETLATDTTNAVTSVKYYKTLTSVLAPSGIGAATVDIGWADEVASQTIMLDWRSSFQANLAVDVTDTLNFTVQEAWDNVWSEESPQQTGNWLNITALASKTADTASQASYGAVAARLILNSYSTGAELQLYVNQPSHV